MTYPTHNLMTYPTHNLAKKGIAGEGVISLAKLGKEMTLHDYCGYMEGVGIPAQYIDLYWHTIAQLRIMDVQDLLDELVQNN